jgi:hypothetical protein
MRHDWRSTVILLVAVVRLALALAFVLAPLFIKRAGSLAVGLIIGIPGALVVHHLVEDHSRFGRYTATFESWPSRRRLVADVIAVLFLVFAIVSPLIARGVVTGKPLLF